jgi:hypothetical protein
MTDLKLVRIDDGVETQVWRGAWNGLDPTFLRCGWQTMFQANLPPVQVAPPPPPPPPVEPPPVVVEPPPPVEPPPVEPPVEPPPPPPPPPVEEPPVVVPPPVVQPPAPIVINVTGGSLPKPTTTADVQALISAAAANDTFVMFDPTTKVDITQPLVMQCKGNAGQPWGILGNGAKLIWKGPAGGKLLTVKGTVADWGAFRSNRGLLIEKLFLDGQGTSGDLLTLEALYGDPGSIYKSVIRDVYCVYSGKNGITLRGAVFESFLDNVHAENCLGHGMETAHDWTDRGGGKGIISNINIIHPNFSRNKRAGLLCTYSTNLTFGSFVLNAEGGVVAPEGLRYAVGNNGENTGEALFVVQYKGYGSHIRGNEVSSDGSTHHRQFEGGKWVSYGSPCLYILSNIVKDIVPGEDFGGNHCSYYGGASTNPMRVIK